MLSIFSCAFWPSVYLHWRNVYLGPVLIFWLECLHHELIYYETCLRKNLRPASKVVSLERNCCHFYISHEGNVIYNKLFTWDCLISRQCEFDMQTCCDVDLRLWNLKKETNKQTNKCSSPESQFIYKALLLEVMNCVYFRNKIGQL